MNLEPTAEQLADVTGVTPQHCMDELMMCTSCQMTLTDLEERDIPLRKTKLGMVICVACHATQVLWSLREDGALPDLPEGDTHEEQVLVAGIVTRMTAIQASGEVPSPEAGDDV